ncbi:MAG: acyl-CoA dehydrogenase family protein [Alphaproteobacteria bacterium]|nr:acyl-CoA dehydrogenase family protein [Alphaproteobacteria bacterium]
MSSEMSGDSELRTILGDQVNRLLADRVGKDALEGAEAGASQDELWQLIEENGLPWVLVPEDQGGVGGGWDEAEVVIRAAGKYQAPVPLVESILAGWLLSSAGLDMLTGPVSMAPVRPDEALSITKDGGGYRVSGTASRVPWGRSVGHLAVAGDCDGQTHIALVPADSWSVEREDGNIALEPRDSLRFDGEAVAAAPLSDSIEPDSLFAFAAMARASQIAGALEQALELTVQYANDRSQFGTPIGKFQAVQQELARMAGEVAAAGAAVEDASRAAGRMGGKAGFEMATAKIRASEAATIVASIAHQTHGAMGHTYEHPLHFVTRRLWSWRAEFGSEKFWAEELGRSLVARGGQGLWSFLVDRA